MGQIVAELAQSFDQGDFAIGAIGDNVLAARCCLEAIEDNRSTLTAIGDNRSTLAQFFYD